MDTWRTCWTKFYKKNFFLSKYDLGTCTFGPGMLLYPDNQSDAEFFSQWVLADEKLFSNIIYLNQNLQVLLM